MSSVGFCTSRSDEFPVFIGEIPRSVMCSKSPFIIQGGGEARGEMKRIMDRQRASPVKRGCPLYPFGLGVPVTPSVRHWTEAAIL